MHGRDVGSTQRTDTQGHVQRLPGYLRRGPLKTKCAPRVSPPWASILDMTHTYMHALHALWLALPNFSSLDTVTFLWYHPGEPAHETNYLV